MKTLQVFCLSLASVTFVLSADAQVYSANVVGYINKPLVGGTPAKYTLVSNPLTNNVSHAISNLFNGLPTGSQVLKWNGTGFSAYSRVAFGSGWTPPGVETNTIVPGEGVFVRTPNGSAGVTNTFVGEVLQGSLTNLIPIGYALKGNMVPDAGTPADIDLDPVFGAGPSQLLKFNSVSQSYNTYNKVSFGAGWTPAVPFINVSEGFFLRNQTASPKLWVRNFTVN